MCALRGSGRTKVLLKSHVGSALASLHLSEHEMEECDHCPSI